MSKTIANLLKTMLVLFIALAPSLVRCESEKNTKILVFGDSLSAAYNIDIEQGWVHLLKMNLKASGISVTITNASISGETTSGGLNRFDAELIKSKPDLVILELGANDGLRGFNLKATRSNLTKMVQMAHSANAEVLLAGIHIPPNYGRAYTQKFDKIFTDLAQLENVSLIPFLLEGVATRPEFMQNDGLHPNPQGQTIILENVLTYLLPMIK